MNQIILLLVLFLVATETSLSYSLVPSKHVVSSKAMPHHRSFVLQAGFGKAKVAVDSKLDNTPKTNSPCACGSGKVYEECCKPVHDNKVTNLNPVQVIRGRFSALSYGVVDYLVKSTHPDAKDYVAEDDGNEKFRSKKTKRTIWERDVSYPCCIVFIQHH
jgi:hypothetical protein